jgi:hypothetical protein
MGVLLRKGSRIKDETTSSLVHSGVYHLSDTYDDEEAKKFEGPVAYSFCVTGKEGMGYGDFKLLAALGAWLGWQMLPVIILLSSVVGAIIGILMIVFRGRDRTIPIPFGPYLAGAGALTAFFGKSLIAMYLG